MGTAKLKNKLIILTLLIGIALPKTTVANVSQVQDQKILDLSQDDIKPQYDTTKKMLLYFWADWCPDCKKKLKGDLKELKNVEKKNNIEIIPLHTSSHKKSQDFLEKHKLKEVFPLKKAKNLQKELKVFSVPHWAVVKKVEQNGKIQWVLLKDESGSNFKKMKSHLLGEGVSK